MGIMKLSTDIIGFSVAAGSTAEAAVFSFLGKDLPLPRECTKN